MARQASKPEVMNDRSWQTNNKVHKRAFYFDSLFISYYAFLTFISVPRLFRIPRLMTQTFPPNANDRSLSETMIFHSALPT